MTTATYKLAKTDAVRPLLPPKTFFVPNLKEVLSVGKYVELSDLFPTDVMGKNIEALLPSVRYGQILSFDYGRQQFEMRAFARVPTCAQFTPEYIDCDEEVTPPLSRPYIQYPDELLATNWVWPFMTIDRILRCEIFVFSQDDLNFSNLRNPYRMRNAFVLSHEYDQHYQTISPTEDIFPFHLHPFPCYTARTWY